MGFLLLKAMGTLRSAWVVLGGLWGGNGAARGLYRHCRAEGSGCRPIKSIHIWLPCERGLPDTPDAVATIFITNTVATGKTEWYSFGEMHWWWITVWLGGWGFPRRDCNCSQPAVLRRGQQWGRKLELWQLESAWVDLPGRAPREALRCSLEHVGHQEWHASSWGWLSLCSRIDSVFPISIHCPWTFWDFISISFILTSDVLGRIMEKSPQPYMKQSCTKEEETPVLRLGPQWPALGTS